MTGTWSNGQNKYLDTGWYMDQVEIVRARAFPALKRTSRRRKSGGAYWELRKGVVGQGVYHRVERIGKRAYRAI